MIDKNDVAESSLHGYIKEGVICEGVPVSWDHVVFISLNDIAAWVPVSADSGRH